MVFLIFALPGGAMADSDCPRHNPGFAGNEKNLPLHFQNNFMVQTGFWHEIRILTNKQIQTCP